MSVDQGFLLESASEPTVTESAVNTDAFKISIQDALAQVHGMNPQNVKVASASVVSINQGRRLDDGAASQVSMEVEYKIPADSVASRLAHMQKTQDPQYRSNFTQYLKDSEDDRVSGLDIVGVYHQEITASNYDGTFKLTSLGDLFTIYGAADSAWDSDRMQAWGKSAAAASQAVLSAALASIIPVARQQTYVNSIDTNVGSDGLSAEFSMFAVVPRDNNMDNDQYQARVVAYRAELDAMKAHSAALYWEAFENQLTNNNIDHLPQMGLVPPTTTTTTTAAVPPTPPPSGTETRGASTSLVLVIFIVLAFVLLLTCLCIVSICKNPNRRRRFCPCCSSRGEDSPTRAFSGDLENSVQSYYEGHDELRGAGYGYGEEFDPTGQGNVNFLDLIQFNNLQVEPKKKAKDKRNGDSKQHQRLVTQKLGSTDDKETEDLRFAMGTFKPWKADDKMQSGLKGSPASTRATTNSSRDSQTPSSLTPASRPLGNSMSGMEETPDQRTSRSLNRSPSLRSDDQVTIETVCSESETSSSEDEPEER